MQQIIIQYATVNCSNCCTYPPEQFRCDAGSCLSCGYNASTTNCPHYENTCGNSCNVAQTQNLSCWTGCNPQSTAVPVNGAPLNQTCETVDWSEALYSSQQSCQTQTVYCYQCDGNSAVGNQFSGTSCPSGWQPTVPSCQPMVDCSTCDGGSPMSNMFSGSCPTGWQLTSLGNPCSPNNGGGGVGVGVGLGEAPIGTGGTQAQAPAGGGATPMGGGGQAQAPATPMMFSGFAGKGKSLGNWQRSMANKIMINDLDWNPITSD